MIDIASNLTLGLGLLWQVPPIVFAIAVLVALWAVIREHRHELDRREPETRQRD